VANRPCTLCAEYGPNLRIFSRQSFDRDRRSPRSAWRDGTHRPDRDAWPSGSFKVAIKPDALASAGGRKHRHRASTSSPRPAVAVHRAHSPCRSRRDARSYLARPALYSERILPRARRSSRRDLAAARLFSLRPISSISRRPPPSRSRRDGHNHGTLSALTPLAPDRPHHGASPGG